MFSRFLEPYLASAFNAGRTIGISAANLRGAYRGDQGGVGDMAMGTGASGNSLRGPRGRNRPKSRLEGVRRARVRRVELEGLEARTLLATIPAAAADGGGRRTSRTMFGNAGGTNASQNSPVVAVDPHDPSKLVAVWVDNDPAMAGDHRQRHRRWSLEAAYSVNGGQSWLPLLAEPTNGLGIPSDRRAARPDDVRPDGPLQVRDRSQPGIRRQRQLLHPDRVQQRRRRPPARPAARWCCRSTTSPGPRPAQRSRSRADPTPTTAGGGGFGGPSDLKVIYQWNSLGQQ